MECDSFDKAAITAFKKVLKPAKYSRNPGKVAVCCYAFFSRLNVKLAEDHEEVMTAAKFNNQYQIKTQMDFIKHCRSKKLEFDPQLNLAECRKRRKSSEEEMAELKAELASLKDRIVAMESDIAEYPVACSNNADESKR